MTGGWKHVAPRDGNEPAKPAGPLAWGGLLVLVIAGSAIGFWLATLGGGYLQSLFAGPSLIPL